MHINKPKNDTSNYQANAQQIFFDSRSLMAACLLSLVSKKISTSSGFFLFLLFSFERRMRRRCFALIFENAMV